ncbi:hypothetical protein K9O30_15040 [Clostridium bowmanii]|uniref:hypothetical protein n=1 Tax=Clostridium bowmanii TaxID=132925 RepID=UPI001C0AF732|nr:hypothetical protein [Clostridium bowmanii]MBU3190741.1 hypothetical protein [Clostridium bowmanii]MCA1075013.1 hypothetical protein [Clostridium bowmanii]
MKNKKGIEIAPAEISTIFEKIVSEDKSYGLLVKVMFESGLRCNEALSLLQ